MPKSEDALDQARPRQKWSKAEKRAYAKKMFEEELIQQPKNPIAPLVLPKKPPHRRHEEEESRAQSTPPPTPPTRRPPTHPPRPLTPTFLTDPVFAPWQHMVQHG